MNRSFTSTAHVQLERAYDEPLSAARNAAASGQGVIGVVGNTAPTELFLAFGKTPITLSPTLPVETPNADALIDAKEPWAMRSIADAALSGKLAFLDLMVITRREEWLYYNLKEAVRIGEGANTPPLHLHDLIPNTAPSIERYNREQFRLLVVELERRYSTVLDLNRLKVAVELCNRQRDLLAELGTLRAKGAIGGVQALKLISASRFLEPSIFNTLLEMVIEGAASHTSEQPRIRVLLATSDPLFHTTIHELIEEDGRATVIAEDCWWGSRSGGDKIAVDGDVLSNVADAYVRNSQSDEAQPRERREQWLKTRIDAGDIDSVIFYMPPSDKRLGWDYPALAKWIRSRDVSIHVIRQNILDRAGYAEIRDEYSSFLGGKVIKPPKGRRTL